jgi:flagella basal body P-ring formation protein FlgA
MRSAIGLLFSASVLALSVTGMVHADENTVVVTLRPTVSVTTSPVCIGHVASLSGGTAMLRARIETLDLAERPIRGKTQPLARELVAYRIQLAGIDRKRFRIEGAPVVAVSAAASLTDDDFLQAARDALLDRFPGRAADMVVTLAQSPNVQPPALTSRDEVRLEAQPREPSNVPGRCRVDVTVFVNGERLGIVSVLVDVQVYESVAVAARRIESGETLSEANVRFERRMVEAMGSCLTARDIAGRKARRVLVEGQVIPQAAVETLKADNPILVKSRDLVKIVARVGGMNVTTVGEAQQEGREGDRIRVRNVDSKKEVIGRVIGRGLVDVDFQ